MIEISVLLTIRNWDLQRVKMCLASLANQVDVVSEVVVVDFGSDESAPLEGLVSEFDVKFVRVEATEWSRSRAMNIAAAHATGRFLIFADADLVFHPKVLSSTRDRLEENPRSVLMFSFRDLPKEISPRDLQSEVDFDELDELAIWRPRWGMGTQAYLADSFWEIRGFDERMKIYGGEDNDIAKRARAHGYKLIWVNERQFGLYHVWHPSSREQALSTPEHKKELEKNAFIAKSDESIMRNLDWQSEENPLITIAISIAPGDHGVRDSIISVLEQSVRDFEILILDYSNSDHARTAIDSIRDERVRYINSLDLESEGLISVPSSAARGKFITFTQCGDVLLPGSLETRIKAINAGSAGAYGGIAEYSSDSGELSLRPGKEFEFSALVESPNDMTPRSLLVETEILKIIRDEGSIQPVSDLELFMHIARSGLSLCHCGDFVVLRQERDKNVVSSREEYRAKFSLKIAWGIEQRAKSRKLAASVETYKYPAHLENHDRIAKFLPSGLIRMGYLFSVLTPGESTTQMSLECEIVDSDGEQRRAVFSESLDCVPSGHHHDVKSVLLPNDEELGLFELFISSLNQLYGDRSFVICNWFESASQVRILLDTEYDPDLCENGRCTIFISDQETGIFEILEQGKSL